MYNDIRLMAENVVANAVIGPDASMDGLTDCYQVPLDDIDRLKAALRRKNEDAE